MRSAESGAAPASTWVLGSLGPGLSKSAGKPAESKRFAPLEPFDIFRIRLHPAAWRHKPWKWFEEENENDSEVFRLCVLSALGGFL